MNITPELNKPLLPTNVSGVDFVIRYRYAAGRKIAMPYFRVQLCPVMQEINGCEFAFVSIAKWGWHTAWKKALISLTANNGRRKVVRFLSRPPRKDVYTLLCPRL